MADDKKPLLDESTVSLSGLPARPEDCQEAMRNADNTTWTAREALCWLKGRDPFWFRGDIFARYQVEWDEIRRAVTAGLLNAEGSTPRQWLEFASSKGWVIPPEFTPHLPATNQPEDSTANTRRGRPKCHWTEEFLRLYDLATAKNGSSSATLQEVVAMAKRHDSQWIRSREGPFSGQLLIRDDKGKDQKRSLKELNRLLKRQQQKPLVRRRVKQSKT